MDYDNTSKKLEAVSFEIICSKMQNMVSNYANLPSQYTHVENILKLV